MTDRNTDAPEDAVKDRAAQKHDLAYGDSGGKPEPGLYPADGLPERKGDITPDAPDPRVEWDERVQPERPKGEDAEQDL